VNAPPATSRGLSDLSQRELQDLLRALDAGWLSFPINELSLGNAGLSTRHCASVARLLTGFDATTARILLEVALAERLYRPPPRLELVWTGPEARGATARDTGIVIRQLFERAAQSVIIAGFRFDQGESIFRPLHERMQHGLDAAMFVDIEGHADTPSGAKAYAERAIDQLIADNWPFGPPFPTIYYDPRSAIAGPPWVSLHAKCIVVDDTFAFITSANFTERGQHRNIEAGVCIEDPDFAERLAAQWRALVARGLVERYGG
jgi:phosphatidylserine/phosphatidylglycerophosphate/cardiolipin synthase-like enzyme